MPDFSRGEWKKGQPEPDVTKLTARPVQSGSSCDNAKMLARAYNRGASIFLEDESGYWSCKDVGLSPLLKNRVEYMKELQKNYIFLFSAVSIYESDIDDGEGVKLLKNMLGI